MSDLDPTLEPTLAPTARPIGRPRDDFGDEPRFFDLPLYKLLEERLTDHVRRGQLNIRLLSADMDVSSPAMYRWLGTSTLTLYAAKALIKVSRGKLSLEDLTPFLLA